MGPDDRRKVCGGGPRLRGPGVAAAHRAAAQWATAVAAAVLVTTVLGAACGPAGFAAARCDAAAPDAAPAVQPTGALVTLGDGDRVLFLGDTFFEREGQRGFIESALATAHPEATIRFRNLGWSGDTVWAESRGVFDAPAKGYERMLAVVAELAPTVVFIAYGRNEAERGEAGLAAFHGQLARLCADVRRAAAGRDRGPATVRLVLVTPTPVETVDAAPRNAALAAYAAAIRAVATAEQAAIVDLFAAFSPVVSREPRTTNGVHLSDAGYAAAAERFVAAAGREPVALSADRAAEVRRLVVEKNTLFFHRWRPANETYIFLFRKHEQGNNAVEMPRFDLLVEEAEQRVHGAIRRAEERP